MQRASSLEGKRWSIVFLLTAGLIVAGDQLSKIAIRSYPGQQPIFEAGLFRIVHTHNTGAIFGLFQGHSFALIVAGLVGVAVILFYVFFVCPRSSFLDSRLSRVALGLILGGTVGNLIDRLNPNLGGVTDFISIGIWPTFNLADSAVTVGAIIFACSLLRLPWAEKDQDGQGI